MWLVILFVVSANGLEHLLLEVVEGCGLCVKHAHSGVFVVLYGGVDFCGGYEVFAVCGVAPAALCVFVPLVGVYVVANVAEESFAHVTYYHAQVCAVVGHEKYAVFHCVYLFNTFLFCCSICLAGGVG